MMICDVALVLLLAAVAIGERLSSFAGPFDIVFHKMERCQGNLAESKLLKFDPMRLIRDRNNPRGWWYNGTVFLGEDFSDKLFIDGRVASWGSRGGWVENAYVIRTDHNCDKAKIILPREMIKNASAAIGHPDVQQICNFPKGEYKVENFYVNLDLSKYFPALPYGKYKGVLKIARDKNSPFEGCLTTYSDIVPKPGGTSASWASIQAGMAGQP